MKQMLDRNLNEVYGLVLVCSGPAESVQYNEMSTFQGVHILWFHCIPHVFVL